MAERNLARLAEALLPLIDHDQGRAIELAARSLPGFAGQYETAWSAGMLANLGLSGNLDPALVADLLELLRENRADYTSFFRALARDADATRSLFSDPAAADG